MTVTKLDEANLQGAHLRGASLYRATLAKASLISTDLRHADFRRAVLTKADLRGTVLTNADLRGADLRGADLKGTNLTNANLLPHDQQALERWSLSNLTSLDLSGERLRPSRLTLRLRRYRWLTWLLPQAIKADIHQSERSCLDRRMPAQSLLGGAV